MSISIHVFVRLCYITFVSSKLHSAPLNELKRQKYKLNKKYTCMYMYVLCILCTVG